MNKASVNLQEAIKHLDNLPAMPLIAQKIMALPLETEAGENQLLRLIEQDPQISARIIGLANAPLFGSSKPVTAIPDAAMLLGITRVKSVAIGIAVMSTLRPQRSGKLDIQNLWMHSLGIALVMRILARAMPGNLRPSEDSIFMAGLLHDLGFLVLQHLDPGLSDTLLSRLEAQPDTDINQIEDEVLTIGHGELGAELARHWGLPDELISVLRFHHHANAPVASAGQTLIPLLHLAEKLLPGQGFPIHVQPAAHESDWLELGIDPARADELNATIQEQAAQARVLSLHF